MLTGLSLALSVSERLPPMMLQTQLAEARLQVGALIAQVRRRSLALRPVLLDDMGLRAALEWHVARYTEQTGVQVDVQIQGVDQRFAPQIELTAYRIVQEALTNVARHSGACKASLHIWVVNDQLVILLEDMGQGFEVHTTLKTHASSGLAGMRERAVLLGGDLTIDSEPGMGTRLLADLPLTRQQPDEREPV
jgi:signal transduction histidine kinase